MSIIKQPCSGLSVQEMKMESLCSPNVAVLSRTGHALSQHHRSLWHQNKGLFLVEHMVQCNATANVWCSLVEAGGHGWFPCAKNSSNMVLRTYAAMNSWLKRLLSLFICGNCYFAFEHLS